MNLLVTRGGAGFIGSNLIHHVIDRPEVKRLVNLDCLTYAGHPENLERVAKNPKYAFEKVDLRDRPVVDVIKKYDIPHVLHLAAESHVDRSITGPGDFISTNIVGTFNLLEAVRGHWGRMLMENDFITFRLTKFMAASARPDFSRKRHLTRRIPPTLPARHRVIFWCEPIITLTDCR